MDVSALDVEISIVNHENRELLRDCLLSLPAACAGIRWHTTVIDNRSGDGSCDMLADEFPDVRIIANEVRLGFGANHNQVLRPLIAGSAHAQGARYVLILNDDTTLRTRAVAAMVQTLDADLRLGAVVPRIVDTRGGVAASRIAYPTARLAWRCDWADQSEPADPDNGFLQGCCLMLRVSAIAQAGPFDERYFLFYEDTDLSRRLADSGWALAVCPDAVVVHIGHASVFQPSMRPFIAPQGRRSRYLYFCKHQGWTRAEVITGIGRLLMLVSGGKAQVGALITGDRTRMDRGQRLVALARFNPRRPVAPERQARGQAPPAPGRGVRTGSR